MSAGRIRVGTHPGVQIARRRRVVQSPECERSDRRQRLGKIQFHPLLRNDELDVAVTTTRRVRRAARRRRMTNCNGGQQRYLPRMEGELALRNREGARNDYRFALTCVHPDRFIFTEEAYRFSATSYGTDARWQHVDGGQPGSRHRRRCAGFVICRPQSRHCQGHSPPPEGLPGVPVPRHVRHFEFQEAVGRGRQQLPAYARRGISPLSCIDWRRKTSNGSI